MRRRSGAKTPGREDAKKQVVYRARWIFSGTGYYRYDQGYTPEFKGRKRFKGQIIHPQHWPEKLDYQNKEVLIIGSGATAVTLLPAMADEARHVTMLQRTPTYIMPLPEVELLSKLLKPVLGKKLAFKITRQKNILRQRWFYLYCQKFPERARRFIKKENAKRLPPNYPVDEHFNPPYNPWDQRLCAVPDSDLFQVLGEGKASIVTDRIKTFTTKGVQLESGKELEADIIITATGLNLLPFGGIQIKVDGKRVKLPEHVAFKGMMLSGIPNLAFAVGYTTSSWTLKVGLLCEHFCRLLQHMERKGFRPFGASSVAEAETLLKKNVPKYAVIDLRLNDGNGLQIVSMISSNRSDSKIVMLTGYGNIPTAVAAVKEGACDYLAKPANADDIESALIAPYDSNPEPPVNPMSADRVKWEHILRVYELCNRNVSETARRLKMHRRTLQRILQKRSPK